MAFPLPAAYRKPSTTLHSGNVDPLDKAIDTVGDKLDPLPWRNGMGASVSAPWSWERARQSPHVSTDQPGSWKHGEHAWSFADSRTVRIEVRPRLPYNAVHKPRAWLLNCVGRWNGHRQLPFESWALVIH